MIRTLTSMGLDLLREIPIVQPRTVGSRWRGVQHGTLLDALVAEFRHQGIPIQENPTIALGRNGADLAAVFEVGHPYDLDILPSHQLRMVIGLTTSNASRSALRFYAGVVARRTDKPSDVFGLVLDSFVGRRYGPGFAVVQQARSAVDRWQNITRKIPQQLLKAARKSLTHNAGLKLMHAAADIRLMPWSRVGRVLEAWKEFPATRLGLLCAFGRIVRMNPPLAQLNQAYKFSQMVLTP